MAKILNDEEILQQDITVTFKAGELAMMISALLIVDSLAPLAMHGGQQIVEKINAAIREHSAVYHSQTEWAELLD